MWSVPRPSPRLLRWLLGAALLLAAYAAAGFWLVPRLVASSVRDTLSERYQRSARLGLVTFNPFSFELDARDFALPDADGTPLLTFDRLYVNLGLISVLRGGPTFQAIVVDKPRVRLVRRANGALNLADFAGPPEKDADASAPPPRLWIDDLSIRDGRATVVDLDRPRPLSLELGPITFQVRKFSTRNEGNEYSLAVQSARGEQLTWRGDFGLTPLASHGKFSLRNIQAQTLAEIAADSVPFQVTRGQLAAEGSYAFAGRGKDLDLNIDVSQLLVETLGLRARDAASDAVFMPRLELSNIQLDLSAQTVAVGKVLFERLQVAAVRDRAGQLNLQRLLPAAPATPSAPAPPQSKSWRIAVPEVVLHATDLELEDQRRSQSAHLHIAPLDLTVRGFASPIAAPLELDLKTRVNESGELAVQGQLDLNALSGKLSLNASSIPLVPFQPYLDEAVGFNLLSGKLHVKGAVSVSAATAVGFEGQAGIDELKTTDKELEEDFVQWASLSLTGLKFQSEPLSLHIADVAVSEPYARVIISDKGATNIQDVLAADTPAADGVAAAPTAAVAPQPTASALPVEIDMIRVDGGSVNFADRSIKPNFETGIQKLSGTVQGLSARPDARADVRLAGEVDRYTPVTITGKVNYFAAVAYTDLRLAFRNLELTSLSPYSGRFAGYRIERGKLKVDLNYLVKKRRLAAKHKIVIDQLQLGAAVDSPDATSLPVKLAIALLKDRNGVIDLDIPVSGNLDDPQFRVWPIIWQVVGNLLTKIVTSPFALLGSLFGAGDEISYVDLTPATATLSEVSRSKLQTLSKALKERPALNLDVPLVIKPDVDSSALLALRWQSERERLARRKLGAQTKDPAAITRLLATPKDYRVLLETAYREAFGNKPVFPQPKAAPAATTAPAAGAKPPAPPPIPDAEANAWLEQKLKARISIGQSDFDELARERAQQVQAIILDGTGIDPSRVFVITATPLAPDAPLRMQLALH